MHAMPARIFVILSALMPLSAQAASAPAHRIIRIQLPATAPHAVSGRLLLFAEAAPNGAVPEQLDANAFKPQAVTVAAQDVARLAPGGTIDIDADTLAYPAGFSALPPGPTLIQAVFDVRRDYAYAGRAAGDLTSKVAAVTIAPGAELPALTLTQTVPAPDPWVPRPGAPAAIAAALRAAHARATPIDLSSHVLGHFWGRPVAMRAWVLTPPGYDAKAAKPYPTVYYVHGFGGSFDTLPGPLAYIDASMQHHDMPPMIWVFLDESSPTGTHEFADSLNNGPWGAALTREFIPYIEARYNMMGEGGRFLTGHSSGGWATLWLQTRYPAYFAGTWSTAPDPSDFHDFTGVDLYAPNANVYRHADGSPVPLMRLPGKPSASLESFARLENVLGEAGGQFASFDWVFSPRGADGRPVPMFDRDTGAVDPAVVAYWHDNYDIASRLDAHWPMLKSALTGKIHVIVGTADTFYLDGPAHRLQAVLDRLGAQAQFTYVAGRSHFDLYKKGDDARGMMKDIASDIYKVASAVKPEAADDDADDSDAPALHAHGVAPAKPPGLPKHN
jgi:hypothetical protein